MRHPVALPKGTAYTALVAELNGNSLTTQPMTELAEKSFLPQVQNRSVIDFPDGEAGAGDRSLFYLIAQVADELPGWGTNILRRDQMLREFVPREPILGGAISTIVARNAAMEWDLNGPKATVSRCHDILHNANFGQGWLDFIGKYSWDLYTQDKGAFVEIIREGDSEDAPVLGIANLDSQRCWHTGDPEKPVWYYDKKGTVHKLKWYQCWTSSEMPMPHENLYGLQFCAVSRIFNAAQTQQAYNQYAYEKATGRHNRAMHVIQGVTSGEVKAALAQTQAAADQRGLTRYIQPTVVASLSPEARVQATTIELSSLPDNFNSLTEFQRYVAIVAMCFLTDYLELAPLPGGNLGTATQAETMERKSHAKGAQLFRKITTHMMNFSGMLPKNVEFGYNIADPDGDKRDEALALQRTQRRGAMIANGEIDANIARQMAVDDGDIPQEIFDKMATVTDVTGAPESVEHNEDSHIDDEQQTSSVNKPKPRPQLQVVGKARIVREIIRDENGNAIAAVEYAP